MELSALCTDPVPPPLRDALALGRALLPARAVLTAAELDLFTVLDERGPLTPTALAEALGVRPRLLEPLLALLVATGLVERVSDDGALRCAPQYAAVLSRRQTGWRAAELFALERTWRAASFLTDALRTGASPRVPADRRTVLAELLVREHRNVERARAWAGCVHEALPAPEQTVLLEVGSGPGTFSAALLARAPHWRAVLFDLALAHDVARRLLPRDWIEAGRVRLRAGDPLQDLLPPGGTLGLLSERLAPHDDVEVRRLLVRLRDALGPEPRLLVRERWLDPPETGPDAPATAAEALRVALAHPHGRLRTRVEGRTLLAAAGWRLEHELTCPGDPGASTFVATAG